MLRTKQHALSELALIQLKQCRTEVEGLRFSKPPLSASHLSKLQYIERKLEKSIDAVLALIDQQREDARLGKKAFELSILEDL